MPKIKIKLNGGIMPVKCSKYAAAYDLFVPFDTELKYGRQVVDLKFSMELPHGYAAIIQPRSGFTCKGMQVVALVKNVLYALLGLKDKEMRVDADVNIGLVDEDYRDNVGALVKSNYRSIFRKAVIPAGTRIAQMRIVRIPDTELIESESLDMTKNRGGGYGHTGNK